MVGSMLVSSLITGNKVSRGVTLDTNLPPPPPPHPTTYQHILACAHRPPRSAPPPPLPPTEIDTYPRDQELGPYSSVEAVSERKVRRNNAGSIPRVARNFLPSSVPPRSFVSEDCLNPHTPSTAFRHLPLRAPLSCTFLQTVPDLVTPLKGHSLSPRSCPATRSAPSERFGY